MKNDKLSRFIRNWHDNETHMENPSRVFFGGKYFSVTVTNKKVCAVLNTSYEKMCDDYNRVAVAQGIEIVPRPNNHSPKHRDNRCVFRGIARLNPKDNFSVDIGVQTAVWRAMNRYKRHMCQILGHVSQNIENQYTSYLGLLTKAETHRPKVDEPKLKPVKKSVRSKKK